MLKIMAISMFIVHREQDSREQYLSQQVRTNLPERQEWREHENEEDEAER